METPKDILLSENNSKHNRTPRLSFHILLQVTVRVKLNKPHRVIDQFYKYNLCGKSVKSSTLPPQIKGFSG